MGCGSAPSAGAVLHGIVPCRRGGPRIWISSAVSAFPLCLRLCRLLMVVICLAMAGTAAALQPEADSEEEPQVLIDRAEQVLDEVEKGLDKVRESEQFTRLAERALAAQRDAQAASRTLAPELEQVQARLQQLGTVQQGVSEPGDLRAERSKLSRQQSRLGSAHKHAELLVLRAQQASERIERQRVQQFSTQLSLRVASPLSPALWSDLLKQAPVDLQKLSDLYWRQRDAAAASLAQRGYGLSVSALLLVLLLALPLRMWLRHLGCRYAASHVPGGRLRRSALALWLVLVGTLTLGLAALVLVECMRSVNAIPQGMERLAWEFVVASFVAAFISSLSTSLLMRNQSTWRLFPIDDAIADRLRWHCQITAVVAWLSLMVHAINAVARSSDALNVASQGVAALLYCALIIWVLRVLARRTRRTSAGDEVESLPELSTRSGGVIVLVRLLGHLTVIVALLATLLGYLNFALFVTSQIIWAGLVLVLTAMLMAFADDLTSWMFRPNGRFSRALANVLGVGVSGLTQFGVLLSAALRVVLVAIGVAALLMPYGSSLSLFASWFDAFTHGVTIGTMTITPGALVRALVVLSIGLGIVHVVQQWLVGTYLPKTRLDPGARNSISTVLRYLGWLVVTLWTLAAMGIGMSQLALVVSALSVGIGFGLQAITQNFVSGLILLFERPVKIGDWVRIGDQEGDIRKINVRATEIQVGDRSTLIVPNSELITKSVRNMTLSNPMGRVQMQFAVPLGVDMGKVRELLLEIFAAHERTVDEPAPSVYIDSISAGHANFNSFVYVGSPREAYRVRSELFFTLLQRMAEAGIALQSPQDIRISR